MRNMTIQAMADAVGGRLVNTARSDLKKEAVSVAVDSRLSEEGGVYIAISAPAGDGHAYIDHAFDKGVLAVICERPPSKPKGACIVVEDSRIALEKLAGYYRTQLSVRVIGIVGSVGKTSTRQMTASVLSSHFNIHCSEGNMNNLTGAALTVLGIRDGHEAAVVEMGISDHGQMDRIGGMVRPDTVVFTNIGPCHLEQLGDIDGVFRAKTEIIAHMPPSGTLILNGNDEKLDEIDETLAGCRRIVRYGKESKRDDVYASDIRNLGYEGSSFVANFPDSSHYEMTVPVPGYHAVENAMAAVATGFIMGLNLEEIRRGLSEADPLSGRGHVIQTDRFTVVDDCYNASPKSMCAAIDMLGCVPGRKVAILGDMKGLGELSDKLHGNVGDYAAVHGADSLIFVGPSAKFMYERARVHEGIEIRYYPNRELLIAALSDETKEIIKPGDTILVKASHSVGFSEVVDYLSNIK